MAFWYYIVYRSRLGAATGTTRKGSRGPRCRWGIEPAADQSWALSNLSPCNELAKPFANCEKSI